ncbi:hypothetical protein HMPREF3156_02641 [Neisseria sp. HMSC06F02]|nr:hypothetical protein HMPREF3156_02641 [Neisseria sp. HMSC06F02]
MYYTVFCNCVSAFVQNLEIWNRHFCRFTALIRRHLAGDA